MSNQTNSNRAFSLLFIIFITLILTRFPFPRLFANAGKYHIPDDLDDVIDDEEDDDWKNWGNKKPSLSAEIDPSELDKMEPFQIQKEMMKRQTGPVFGFVKLRFGIRRTPEDVSETAMKWTNLLKTGGLKVKFMGMDLSTIMFNTETGQDIDELKEFILEQSDAYEIKIGDNVFRRPGDPPLEEVLERLRREKDKANPTPDEQGQHEKDEL